MSHNVYTMSYPENVNKTSVQAYWDETAAHDDWQEGCSGLSQKIRWIDHVCTNEEEAEQYIKDHDSGWYDQLAVKYLKPTKPLTSSTKARLEKQIATYKEKIVNYENEHSLQKQKANFISCPVCSSKLSRMHLKGNGCPVCHTTDIRAQYIIEQIKSYNDKIKEWQKAIKEEDKKLAERVAKSSKVMWLVKIEYHT